MEIQKGFKEYGEDIIALPVSIFSNDKTTPRAYLKKGMINLDEMPEDSLKFTYSSFLKKHSLMI